jgi:hypothetical protein
MDVHTQPLQDLHGEGIFFLQQAQQDVLRRDVGRPQADRPIFGVQHDFACPFGVTIPKHRPSLLQAPIVDGRRVDGFPTAATNDR